MKGVGEQIQNTQSPFWKKNQELTVEGGIMLWGIHVHGVLSELCKRDIKELHRRHTGVVRIKVFIWEMGQMGDGASFILVPPLRRVYPLGIGLLLLFAYFSPKDK